MQFEEIYKEKSAYVMRVCLKWLKIESYAEEASQEFFFWLSRNLSTFDESKGTFTKWFNAHLVFKLGQYKHHLKFKGRGGNGEIEITSAPYSGLIYDGTQEEINVATLRGSLIKAMDKLSDAQKRVMLLTLNTDYTQSEMGKELGMSQNGVKFHQYNSYPIMKKALLKQV